MLLCMLGRLTTYVVPVAAVLFTMLVLVGPGAARPALGARVFGLPTAGTNTLALRLEGVRRLATIDDAFAFPEVTVEVTDGQTPLPPAQGAIDRDGVGEVVLHADTPLAGPLQIRVRSGERLLGEGSVQLEPPRPLARESGELHGTTSGNLSVRVFATRGQLASPFADPVRIEVTGAAGATVEASAPGAEITPAKVTTDARGAALVEVKPLAHTVELALEARAADGRAARWEGLLPVLPGAIWCDRSRAPGTLGIVSPVPRERAYVSFVSAEGHRLLGAIVPLGADAQGFYRGELALPQPATGAAVLVVSGEPAESGESTVAWPLDPPEGRVKPPGLTMLLDGIVDAEVRERARAARARRAALGVVAASALFEILLLLLRSKRAQRALDAGLTEAAGPVPEADRKLILAAGRESPALRALVALALVLLAFAVMAAASTFR